MGTNEPVLSTEAIQGNVLRGFDTELMSLLGLRLPSDKEAARAYIRIVRPRFHALRGTHALRLVRSAGMEGAINPIYTNVAFSMPGLERLGLTTAGVRDPFFRAPMGEYAGSLNDALDAEGKPTNYVLGQTWDDTPEVLLVIGSNNESALDAATQAIRDEAAAAGCTVSYSERGAKLPGGAEHFGFRDGISQVGCRGLLSAATSDYLTPRYFAPEDPASQTLAKPGQPLVWPGQFVFGYPGTDPDDLAKPGEVVEGGESWMRNGSFLVFRRLRQDVAAFRAFGASAASTISAGIGRAVSTGEVEALIVGRWPDGTPLLADATGPNATVSSDEMRINNFDYRTDTPELTVLDQSVPRTIPAVNSDRRAQACPMFAHVRKVNARGMPTDQPGLTASFQMMRRGIPYGPLQTAQPDKERGLLFMAYMTSVEKQFRLLNSQWMNNPLAPEVNAPGHDMLVGQALAGTERSCTLKDSLGNVKATLTTNTQWVIPTGGGVFFSPGLDLLNTF